MPGITVEWTEVDDRYDASQVPLAYRELKAKNPDVIFTMTAVSSAGLKPLVDRDRFPSSALLAAWLPPRSLLATCSRRPLFLKSTSTAF